MIKKKEKKLLLPAYKGVQAKLLPYKSSNSTELPEQNVSKEKVEAPLFYDRPIHKGKKHEFF